ncbi:MarR family winged helix-turn-helix transcriptional regulator [Rhizobium halophytocola]|uniref:DNA-binding MarR family transcriptional regulator n=1 Tax=Rhizobium halophytocola TaxID=735519 RepID=A0ABS4DU28_9HYPH|nr:MarR family winged helix-turn-helix transcriptional regulator [Rhizobium halophytocola]MBP1849185.1 DNA-binding MarR family transcriptional regulator [Rhizobium halophytocola]
MGTPYDVTEQVGHLLRRVYQRHLAIFQENVQDPSITSVQFVTLCVLRDRGPSSQTELVRATAIDQGTIRGIIDRLTARDLISVSRDDQDGRKVIMALTPAAHALLGDLIPSAARISDLTMEGLNPAERVAFLYLLRRLLETGTGARDDEAGQEGN